MPSRRIRLSGRRGLATGAGPHVHRGLAVPRIIHYDDALGSRVESGATRANGAAKTANRLRICSVA
ncbi:MAG: hypothetical protein LC799_01510 [Actinobacteria bacterium]|nr:hypothetical protein [Actinomycetota bacterium]